MKNNNKPFCDVVVLSTLTTFKRRRRLLQGVSSSINRKVSVYGSRLSSYGFVIFSFVDLS
jgi:hypothetical protein